VSRSWKPRYRKVGAARRSMFYYNSNVYINDTIRHQLLQTSIYFAMWTKYRRRQFLWQFIACALSCAICLARSLELNIRRRRLRHSPPFNTPSPTRPLATTANVGHINKYDGYRSTATPYTSAFRDNNWIQC